MDRLIIRPATREDAHACREIYRPYVEHSTLTFETVTPSLNDMSDRIDQALARHTWLVLELSGVPVGYASAKQWDQRAAYEWACETGIYLDRQAHGIGAGRRLYAALLERLQERGFRTAIGRIALPNEASVGLHNRLGFEAVGTLRRVGWKQGSWHDVILMQRLMGDPRQAPGSHT